MSPISEFNLSSP